MKRLITIGLLPSGTVELTKEGHFRLHLSGVAESLGLIENHLFADQFAATPAQQPGASLGGVQTHDLTRVFRCMQGLYRCTAAATPSPALPFQRIKLKDSHLMVHLWSSKQHQIQNRQFAADLGGLGTAPLQHHRILKPEVISALTRTCLFSLGLSGW